MLQFYGSIFWDLIRTPFQQTVQTATGSDFVTLKYGPDGDQLWMAKYAGPNNDFAQP